MNNNLEIETCKTCFAIVERSYRSDHERYHQTVAPLDIRKVSDHPNIKYLG